MAGRRACAALGAVEEARAKLPSSRRKHRRALRRSVIRAERALRALKATRGCAPPVHRIRLTLIHPKFNPNVPPAPTSHEQGGEDDFSVPADPHAKPLPPQGPPTDVTGGGGATTADVTSPLQIFGSADLGSLGNAYPQEPQVAQKGGVVLYSGNTNGAVSLDSGTSFQSLDPAQVFGNDQPICCDTVVRYAPSIDRFIWVLQYWCPMGPSLTNGQQTANCDDLASKNNRYRVAVISPAQLLAHRADPTQGWTVYELTASSFSSTTWLDYPDVSVGSSNLYMTCDEVGRGGLNIRIPLSQLTRSGSPSGQWFRGSAIFWRVAENSGSTGLYLKDDTDSRDIVYAWPDSQPFPIQLGLPHATRPDFRYETLTPSSQNWNDRTGSPVVKGATVSGNQLWVAWTAGRFYNDASSGPAYPQSHIQIAVYDASDLFHALFTGTLRVSDQRYIWSSSTAYADPILSTNSDGDVAMTFAGADSHSMPAPYVAILTNRPFTVRAAVSLGPTTAVEGDYAGLTRDFDDPTKWVAANTFTTTGAGGALGVHWLYTRFGRGPNPAPPSRSPTSIVIHTVTGTSFDCCFFGDTFHTNGVLAGAPATSTVRLDYSTSGTSFSHTVTTDVEGNFTDAWNAPPAGSDQVWTITAHYAGDATHEPADSDPFLQNVQPPPG